MCVSLSIDKMHIMLRNIFLFLTIFLFGSMAGSAQNIIVSGDVSDGLTGRGLNNTPVRIYDAQSGALLGSDMAKLQKVTEKGDSWENTYYDDKNGALFAIRMKAAPEIKVVVEAGGYEPWEKTIAVDQKSRQWKVSLGSISLAPKTKERHLDEVTVKATRLKFLYSPSRTCSSAARTFSMATFRPRSTISPHTLSKI